MVIHEEDRFACAQARLSADQAGYLEVFARNSSGTVVHAWQGNGTDGWVWGASAASGSGSPGTTKGDPAAITQPDGDVAIFVTDTDGTVATSAQNGPNGAGGWSPWVNIGGACGGWPVPFVTSAGAVDLFCRTTGGTLAISTWNGSTWGGWATVGTSPANLAGDPATVSNADGHTELFLATSSGALDHVWQDPSTGNWVWGSSLGSGVSNTPSAFRWPDGRVEVFFQFTNGELGHDWQKAANGATGWAGIHSLGATVLGSPRAFVNADGSPEVLNLDLFDRVAHIYWTGSGWWVWSELGGSL